MPLSRSNVTIASRVMLPAYPLFSLGVGLSFTLTPMERLLASPGLSFADQVVGIRTWGLGYLTIATLLIVALLAQARRWYQRGLIVLALWMLAWAAVLFGGALSGTVSWSAWSWPAFVAVACWASLLSLESGETS